MSIRTRSSFLLAMLFVAPLAWGQDVDLSAYRERFKSGLDRYEQNDIAGALSFWEPLYRDLGPDRGYRVGYNLARAYEVLGDATRSAERYDGFLHEVEGLRKSGKPIEEEVASDERQAKDHLENLARTRGRIHVSPATPPESVRIDDAEPRLAGFVAYVAPGSHDVVFAPGSGHEHRVHVSTSAGEMVDVAPPPLPVKPPPPPVVYRDELHHPFGAGWIVVSGVATLVAGALTTTAYLSATSLYTQSVPSPTATQRSEYAGAQTLAYASWAGPIVFGVLTVALIAWYAVGSKHVKVPVVTALAF